MKISSKTTIGLAAAAGALVLGVGLAQAGIVGSKHDLSSSNTASGGPQGAASTTPNVCVFCHTPHGSDTDAAVPLWNKNLQSGAYVRYSSLKTSTLDGEEAPIGSVTLACLSCHDGTQAMDVMLNKPGSGGYTAGGAELDAAGREAMTGTAVPMLGVDLSNDHPVSIQYAGGGLTSANADGSYTSSAFGDKDFNRADKKTINGVPVWWVDDGDGVREKTDMQLYTRALSGTTQPFVECASCHDPHNADNDGGTQVAFLRKSNSASAVCLACHNK